MGIFSESLRSHDEYWIRVRKGGIELARGVVGLSEKSVSVFTTRGEGRALLTLGHIDGRKLKLKILILCH